MLRHCLKQKLGFNMPIKTIGLQVRSPPDSSSTWVTTPVTRALSVSLPAEDDPAEESSEWLAAMHQQFGTM